MSDPADIADSRILERERLAAEKRKRDQNGSAETEGQEEEDVIPGKRKRASRV